MSTARWPAIGSAALALTLFATACGGGGDAAGGGEDGDLVEAARSEGTVTWYVSIPEEPVQAVASAFEEEYGVPVEVVRMGSSVLAQRYSTERDSGQSLGDLITIPENHILEEYTGNGWLRELPADRVDNLASWPQEALYEDTYFLVNSQPIGLAYNTDELAASDLQDWEDLLAPELESEIVMADPVSVLSWAELLRTLKEEYGEEYLRDLAGQDLQKVDSAIPGTQQVAAGESLVAFPSLPSVVNPLKESGAPVELAYLSPTTGVEQYTAVAEGSPHPNAALLFTDFLMSEEGQTALNEGFGISPLGELDGTLPEPEGYVAPDLGSALEEQQHLNELIGF
ncbi:extracellular solute-binding protein [Thermobifida halotolerans]|uniref:Extracellular solute-binding protein n=1 Tax=Thermobifida halotolerans TaxID=483545 RepID=A0A399G9I9_9ACTN|nr:extracellular solute-binding protein [Thermobifida halotolerans]UOE20434.1 extracellular solute-binding protein [Thermobifida halotolerans]